MFIHFNVHARIPYIEMCVCYETNLPGTFYSILTQRRVVVRKRDKKKLDHHNNNNNSLNGDTSIYATQSSSWSFSCSMHILKAYR